MRHTITFALAITLTVAAGCSKDKPAATAPAETTTPATTPPPATADTPATPAATDAHAGHRHEPSDPYYCPMHPEETAKEAGAKCPVCEMEMQPRKK